jgi:hypothetical protein
VPEQVLPEQDISPSSVPSQDVATQNTPLSKPVEARPALPEQVVPEQVVPSWKVFSTAFRPKKVVPEQTVPKGGPQRVPPEQEISPPFVPKQTGVDQPQPEPASSAGVIRASSAVLSAQAEDADICTCYEDGSSVSPRTP